MEKNHHQKLRDMVYGFAVGDALGVPFEGKGRGTFQCTGMTGYGVHHRPPGTWSDDTSLMLATCDSIRACSRINLRDIMIVMSEWYLWGRYAINHDVFDCGNVTRIALNNFIDAMPAEYCGVADDEIANGNGALMRILPLAFLPDIDADTINNVAGLTHNTSFNCAYCRKLVQICRDLINGKDYQNDELKSLPIEMVRSSGYVADTFVAAIWCLLNSDNYKDTVLTAVNLGGDTDTITAIAGGLAGVKYGSDAIPKEWVEQLRGRHIIENCLF